MRIPRCHVGPAIIIRQVQRYVVSGLALTQHEADALKILSHVRHDDPPGILFVEDTGCIKAPTWIFDSRCRVRPTMANQLIDALKKMDVRLSFNIEWRGAEGRGVEPGPGFGRSDRSTVEMACRRGPT